MQDGSGQNPKALLFHLEWGRNGPCEMTMQVLQFWTRPDISVRKGKVVFQSRAQDWQ